jgi:O-acetyl-ADP-ribose deacetylase (regulator of RNase III)
VVLEGPKVVLDCLGKRVEVFRGDITESQVDAIVNPANSLMIMGGGVAGALRRAAGEEVEIEARRYAPVPVGEAIATSAGRLTHRGVKAIIHAPTMERPAMRTTIEKVRKAVRAAMKLASDRGYESIALPAMGAGVGGVPVKDSVYNMLEVILDHWKQYDKPKRAILVAYSDTDLRQFEKAVNDFLQRYGSECRRVEG